METETARPLTELAFTYGPLAFVAVSFVASVPLAKWLGARVGRPRPPEETFWERPALGARIVSLLAALSLIWSVASAVGLGVLAVPDPRGTATRIRFDAALLVHAIPPLSGRAADRIAAELRRSEGASRFSPPGEMEGRWVAAARVDPRPERAVAELAARGFRTHAGRFALASSSLAVCDAGLDALADALQGSALQELMLRCRNAPGDAVGRAAFKMGDFQRGVGSETESIISRQPRSPSTEPSCFAGGFDVPPTSQPLCRLIHAEMVPKTRAEIHATRLEAPRFAMLWSEVARLEKGQEPSAAVRFTIDPELLVRRPRAALRDQPMAIYADASRRGDGVVSSIGSAWVRLAIAAAASQQADPLEAQEALVDALSDIDSAGEDEPQHIDALRLALAVALRAGYDDKIEAIVARLPEDDPLAVRASWRVGAAVAPSERPWVRLVAAGAPGAEIADALDRESDLPEDLGRLSIVPERERPPLREWAREDFPPCRRCDFAEQIDRLALRLDAARALGDRELAQALDGPFRRYHAVVLNRVLALSLRASEPQVP